MSRLCGWIVSGAGEPRALSSLERHSDTSALERDLKLNSSACFATSEQGVSKRVRHLVASHPGLVGAHIRSVVSVPGLCNRNCAHAEPFALSLQTVEGLKATSQDHSANPEREPLTTYPEVVQTPGTWTQSCLGLMALWTNDCGTWLGTENRAPWANRPGQLGGALRSHSSLPAHLELWWKVKVE